MPEERFLTLHLHELLQYLNRRDAASFLSIAQHGMMGDMRQPIDGTDLADCVIMLRYFGAFGRVRRAISVVKKRTGAHEDTTWHHPRRAIARVSGLLRGVPTYVGRSEPLLGKS